MLISDLTLRAICGELERASYKWFKIGIQLGIPWETLKQFEKEHDPLSAVINYWLNRNVTESDVPISWHSIVSALKTVREAGLAEQIKAKYCQQESTEVEKGKISSVDKPHTIES